MTRLEHPQTDAGERTSKNELPAVMPCVVRVQVIAQLQVVWKQEQVIGLETGAHAH